MTERVAVVIPYFQRQPGLLARALRSVFGQTGVVDPWVVVVDDSSPIPAEAELEGLDSRWRDKVLILHQPNGGCGSARDLGFDALPEDIAYVALLDADDVWKDDHLDQAMAAMRLGYDFYFCDSCWENDPSGNFARVGLDAADHTPILPDRALFAFKGDFFDQTLHQAPVPVSTVVIRRDRLGHLRFTKVLRPLCEDLLFWLDVARETDRVAFSTRISVVYGYGVSLSQVDDWASAKALANVAAYLRFHAEVRRRFSLTPAQAELVADRIHRCQADLIHTVFGMIRRGRWPDQKLIAGLLPRFPRLLAIAPRILVASLAGRRR